MVGCGTPRLEGEPMPPALLGKMLSIGEGGNGLLAAGPCSWLPAGRNMLLEVSLELGFSLGEEGGGRGELRASRQEDAARVAGRVWLCLPYQEGWGSKYHKAKNQVHGGLGSGKAVGILTSLLQNVTFLSPSTSKLCSLSTKGFVTCLPPASPTCSPTFPPS